MSNACIVLSYLGLSETLDLGLENLSDLIYDIIYA